VWAPYAVKLESLSILIKYSRIGSGAASERGGIEDRERLESLRITMLKAVVAGKARNQVNGNKGRGLGKGYGFCEPACKGRSAGSVLG
jgi:hypothetical protein